MPRLILVPLILLLLTLIIKLRFLWLAFPQMLRLPLLLVLPLSPQVQLFKPLISMPKLISIVRLPLLVFLLALLISAFLALLVRYRIMLIILCKVLATVLIALVLHSMVIRRGVMLKLTSGEVLFLIYASFQRGLGLLRLLITGGRVGASCVLHLRGRLTRSVLTPFPWEKSSMLIT